MANNHKWKISAGSWGPAGWWASYVEGFINALFILFLLDVLFILDNASCICKCFIIGPLHCQDGSSSSWDPSVEGSICCAILTSLESPNRAEGVTEREKLTKCIFHLVYLWRRFLLNLGGPNAAVTGPGSKFWDPFLHCPLLSLSYRGCFAVCVMGTVLSEKGAAPQPDTLPAAAWRVQMLGSSQQQGGALSNSPMSSEGKAVAMSCLMILYIIWIIITLRHANHKSRAQKNEDDPCVQRAGWWGRMRNAPVLEERKRPKYGSVMSVLFMQGSWNRLVTLTRFKKE